MCFSASASFIVSAGLAGAGIASITRAKKNERWIAMVPIFFSVQQAIEGFQWLAEKPSTESLFLGYGFLFFAFLFWPVYTPLVVYLNEKNRERKFWLKIFTGVGLGISIYLLTNLLNNPLTISTSSGHINYGIQSSLTNFSAVAYVLILTLSLLLSSKKTLHFLGGILLLSAIIAILFYEAVFISVWCFFAAVLSGLIVLYFRLPSRFLHFLTTKSTRIK